MYEKCYLNFTYYMRRAIFNLNLNYQNTCWKYWTDQSTLIISFHIVKISPTVKDEVPFHFYSVHFLVIYAAYAMFNAMEMIDFGWWR